MSLPAFPGAVLAPIVDVDEEEDLILRAVATAVSATGQIVSLVAAAVSLVLAPSPALASIFAGALSQQVQLESQLTALTSAVALQRNKRRREVEEEVAEQARLHPGRGYSVMPRQPQINEEGFDLYSSLLSHPLRFRIMCRFTHNQFDELHDVLEDALRQPRNVNPRNFLAPAVVSAKRRRRSKLSTQNMLLAYLITCKNRGSVAQDIARWFCWNKSSVYLNLYHVAQAIVAVLERLEMIYPSEEERRATRDHGANHALADATVPGFPRAVGLLDCCHFRVQRPIKEAVRKMHYRGDKKVFTCIAQGVVDPSAMFVHWHWGGPGNQSDAEIYRQTPFYQAPASMLGHPAAAGMADDHILVDGGYQGCDDGVGGHLIRPFRKNELRNLQPATLASRHEFNLDQRSARIPIEWGFGDLKTYWQIHRDTWTRSRLWLSVVVRANVLLTNRLNRINNRRAPGYRPESHVARRIRLQAEGDFGGGPENYFMHM